MGISETMSADTRSNDAIVTLTLFFIMNLLLFFLTFFDILLPLDVTINGLSVYFLCHNRKPLRTCGIIAGG